MKLERFKALIGTFSSSHDELEPEISDLAKLTSQLPASKRNILKITECFMVC